MIIISGASSRISFKPKSCRFVPRDQIYNPPTCVQPFLAKFAIVDVALFVQKGRTRNMYLVCEKDGLLLAVQWIFFEANRKKTRNMCAFPPILIVR